MPETTQFMFPHREIVEMLLKKAGATSGHWQLVITFGFTAANVGTDEKNVSPTAMVSVNQIGIQKIPDGSHSDSGIVVDAAKMS